MSRNRTTRASRPSFALAIRILSVPIILLWLATMITLNVVVPQLEVVTRQNSVALSPQDAPAVIAAKHMGEKFREYDSDSAVMVVLESRTPLGDDAKRYYTALVKRLEQDTAHVQHVQNFWGERVTAAGAQSEDAKAAYVQVNLAGDQGSTAGKESVAAVRDIVAHSAPPGELKVYVTGQAALVADTDEAGDRSMVKMTIITLLVITVMLLLVFRSIATTLIALTIVLAEMGMARGLIATLGNAHAFGMSTFVVSLLTALAIAAGTDYFIFLIGRYHEARRAGEDREQAYYTALAGVTHVVLGSGLTIAGALLCLRFTRLNYFNTIALPCALGLLIVLAMALTFAPAILSVSSRLGVLDPRRGATTGGYRRLATAVVRWPAPILVAALAVTLVGLIALPGYRSSYDNRFYIPGSLPSNLGYTAAERHFSASRLNPDLLMVEADHDLRNPVDLLVLDRIAKNIFRVPGIALVQSITRPLGPLADHGTIPFQMSMQSSATRENLQFLQARLDDMLKMAEDLNAIIAILRRTHDITQQLADTSHAIVGQSHEIQETTNQIRDHLADFDDFFRPMRSYFYWERHCFDVPICWALRSLYDSMDGVDDIAEQTQALLKNLDKVDVLLPELSNQIPPIIAITASVHDTILTLHTTISTMLTQIQRLTDTAVVMGQNFDDAKNDDFFYLPPEAFDSPDFQRAVGLLISPDGKAARFTITHEADPASLEGIADVKTELRAAKEAVKGSPLADAKFFLGGTAATYRDIQEASAYDLMIAAIAAIILIFVVMVVITRALIAACVIVGTVVLSLASSFGLSVLLWQDIVGVKLHWIVIAMSVIVLLAVGSDYNLLVITRFKEELPAGMKTGLIRALASTGGVVTSAGLVFAFTMMSMITSDLRSIGQVGTTIGLGLLLDTFIIRSLVTPSIATLLGRWFWWPMTLPKPASRKPQMANDAPTAPEPVAVTVAAGHEARIPIPTGDAQPDPSADDHR
jgi:putative drug exporter of the RND superfamily